MDTPGYPGTSHPGRFLSHSHCRPRRVIRRNRRISRFIPSAIQSCCCASVVESSFAQSAPLISYLLSELLQSANIRSHTRIMARRPLYPLIHVVVRVVVEGDRHVSHEYYYSYLFHYSHNCHTSSCIRNFPHRSISTFPPSPHDRPLLDTLHLPPPAPQHRNHTHLNSELSCFAPLSPLPPFNYILSYITSPQCSTRLGPP